MPKPQTVTVPGHKYGCLLSRGRYAIVSPYDVSEQARTIESARVKRKRYSDPAWRIYDLLEGEYVK